MYSYIKVLEENKIAEITLNRPERMNAITVDLLVELKFFLPAFQYLGDFPLNIQMTLNKVANE